MGQLMTPTEAGIKCCMKADSESCPSCGSPNTAYNCGMISEEEWFAVMCGVCSWYFMAPLRVLLDECQLDENVIRCAVRHRKKALDEAARINLFDDDNPTW